MATLRSIRRNQLLSQRDLARRTGLTVSTIHLIEAGRTQPRLSVMCRLCGALNVQPLDVDEFRTVLEVESVTVVRRQVA
jgi:transcriptional regulator with XRE-family HTH domain